MHRDDEWNDIDVDAALQWQAEQRSLCNECHQPRDITFAPESFGRFLAEPLVCHACAARERAARKFAQDKGDSAGVKYSVIDREEVPRG